MGIINSVILCILMQVPAIKSGDVILVDKVVEQNIVLESTELKPNQLVIMKANFDQEVPYVDQKVKWELTIDDKPILFIVGYGGDNVGFTYNEGKSLAVKARLERTYLIQDVQWEQEGELYRKTVEEKRFSHESIIEETFQLSAPNPDPLPDPDDDIVILTGIANDVYEAFGRFVVPRHNDRALLIKSAREQARNFRGYAAQVAAGTIRDNKVLLEETFKSNKKIQQELGLDSSVWHEFGINIQNIIYDEYYKKNKLRSIQDYQRLWGEIAEGLEAVK